MMGGSLGRHSRSQRRNPNNPNSGLGQQQQQKHTPKHLPLPTSLDAAAVMITSTGSNPNSPRSPAFQQHIDYFKQPGSPSLTPPIDPYSVGASGYDHNHNHNHPFRGTSAEMVRPPRRSTSAIQRSASPLGYGSATSQLQALKLAPHKSQPDLHAGLMRGSKGILNGGGYTDLNGRLSPPGVNGGSNTTRTTTTVKMGGRHITISAPLLQRRGTDGESFVLLMLVGWYGRNGAYL
jgi:hypothetical protein